MKDLIRLVWLSVTLVGFAGTTLASVDEEGAAGRGFTWPDEVVELAAGLPVQDHGRVKPLSTVAGYTLLRIHHTRSVKDLVGDKLGPTEWLLDVLLFPELADRYALFRIASYEVAESIGISTQGKKKRGLYSYEELEPGLDRLADLARAYHAIDAKEQTRVQSQIVALHQNVFEYQRLRHFLDFARADFVVDGVMPFAAQDDGAHTRRYSEILAAGPAIAQSDSELSENTAVRRLLSDMNRFIPGASGLALIPPNLGMDQRPEWATPADLAMDALGVGPLADEHVAMLASLEGLVDDRESPDALAARLNEFSTESRSLAGARGELEKVDMEVRYYGLDPFYRSLVLYLLGFVMVAITWARPGMRKLFVVAMATTAGGFAIHTTGIVLRCLIRSRPPISTLYETVLFVAGAAVLVSLLIELVDRRRMAGAVSPILGALGLFIAMRFEALKGEDTMPQLQAVLDTNFWLATHVTCITLGYSAGLLAAAFAHVYVLGKVFGIQKDNREGYRSLGKTVYGTICFALLFSVVGTILGGIWANYSWGRFWGWDPKENGALMICLSQLALLHGRMGGYLKTFGVCMATIAQAIVIAFSWWGVNLLSIGLHSYGFTAGIANALNIFYAIEGGVLLLGMGWWMRQRMGKLA